VVPCSVACAVLAVAGDAGGARALTPVIRALRARPNVTVDARAYGAALEVWHGERLSAQPIGSDDPTGFDRVLLATSFVRERWEMRVVRRARQLAIPALVVVDFWSQYRERFAAPEGDVQVPDRIAAVDEVMRRELIAAGLPAERIVVSGQPAYEALRTYGSTDQRQAARAALRSYTPAPFGHVRVLFVAQPLSLQYALDDLGYHEDQVLADTVAALGTVVEMSARHASLLIKPHPRDDLDLLRGAIPRSHSARLAIRVLTAADLDVRLLALGSDLVIGMNSTALMEACLLRRPVLSYQPSLRIGDPLPSNRLGWSRAVYDPDELCRALQQELFDPSHRRTRLARLRRINLPSGAAQQIADLVLANQVAVRV
jgi:hypothetical protein